MIARRIALLLLSVSAAACFASVAAAAPARDSSRSTKATSVCSSASARAKAHGSWWRGSPVRWWRGGWMHGRRKPCLRSRALVTDMAPSVPGELLPATPTNGDAVGTTPEQLGHSVQVRAREYSLTLSRSAVAAGDVYVEFNTVHAEDPHDLHLRNAAGDERALFGETAAELLPPPREPFPITAGNYLLFCAIPGHEALGMSAPISAK